MIVLNSLCTYVALCYLKPSTSSPLDNKTHPMANTSQASDLEGIIHHEMHGIINQAKEGLPPLHSPLERWGELEGLRQAFQSGCPKNGGSQRQGGGHGDDGGLRPGPLFDSLSKSVRATLSELQSKANKYIAAEELAETE
ncbi:hypothetical protein Acr_15g0002460 [Actinidia rufa]|uniref:Uncharacterized protein n=1 Tax=Actinidia rufa TaxID=165716 RepID=A0A7J0FT96_9ERIC|nr:hypothetical protein Acr_15g0002460 [Actinidia rufa]